MPLVLQQDLRCLLDPLVIKPALGHVLQDGDIGHYLLGVVVLTGDGHCQPPVAPVLLDKILLTLSSIQPQGKTRGIIRPFDSTTLMSGPGYPAFC
jgi:hypothetical protein